MYSSARFRRRRRRRPRRVRRRASVRADRLERRGRPRDHARPRAARRGRPAVLPSGAAEPALRSARGRCADDGRVQRCARLHLAALVCGRARRTDLELHRRARDRDAERDGGRRCTARLHGRHARALRAGGRHPRHRHRPHHRRHAARHPRLRTARRRRAGKFKLSQNRSPADRDGVLARSMRDDEARALARAMRRAP